VFANLGSNIIGPHKRSEFGDVAGVFAGMFVLAAFVIVIDTIVTAVEKRLLVWRPLASDSRP